MDRDEFEACWREHVRPVTAYAERHVGREGSYDVVSATFLVVWRTWERVPDAVLPLLLSIARGQIRNHLRSTRRQRGLQARLQLLADSAYDGPDVAAVAVERALALETLANLPTADREAILLVAWDGLTPDEAATVLGCRPGTLRTRLYRARQRLEQATSTRTTAEPDPALS